MELIFFTRPLLKPNFGYAHDLKIFIEPGDINRITAERSDTLSNPAVATGGSWTMLSLYGRETSINVQKVMWCAAELELNVKREDNKLVKYFNALELVWKGGLIDIKRINQ